MNIKNYADFKVALKEATKDTFATACEAYGKENLSGFALFSDEFAMTISVTINTFDYLNKAIQEEPDDELYYRFTPDEWKEEMFFPERMDLLNEWLVEKNEEMVGSELQEHGQKIWNIAVNVLEELKKENQFSGVSENFLLMFSISDFFDAEYQLNNFKCLNSPVLFQKYEEYIEEQEMDYDYEEYE